MQKAIRRGLPELASRTIHELHGVDPAWCRYRMAVIAFEDVAAGSPELVTEITAGAWNKAHVEHSGGVEFMALCGERMANAVKDRTPCNLFYAADFIPDFQARHGNLQELDARTAMGVAGDTNGEWWERALAIYRIAGKKAGSPIEVEGLESPIDRICELFPKWKELITAGAKSQREWHHLGLGLSMEWQETENATVTENHLENPMTGPWLSAAMDGHTRAGQQAIRDLIRAKHGPVSEMEMLGLDREAIFHIVRRMLFWTEGEKVNIQKDYATARQILKDHRRFSLRQAGINPHFLLEHFGDPHDWQKARERMAPGIRTRKTNP